MDQFIARVREVLSTTPDRWRTLAGSMEPSILARRPAPGEWSAAECMQHLLDTELGAFSVRLEAFMAGRDLAAFDPDAAGFKPEPGSDPTGVAGHLAEARSRSLRALDRITAADLDRTANHAEYGQVTLREMLAEWAAHDLMHTVQAERALMQPFIVACGKWRGLFVAHDVEAHAG
jgi:hypothetical protein